MGALQMFATGRTVHSALRLLTAALLSAALVLPTAPWAAAGVGDAVLTFNESGFLRSRPIVSTETFEEFASPTEFPTNQRRIVIDSVRYRSVDPAPPFWTIELDGFPMPDNVLLRRFSSGADTAQLALGFRDGGSVRAVGFRLQPFATSNRFEIVVTEANGNTTSSLLAADIGTRYIGLSSPNRIKRVLISQRPEPSGGFTNFALDDVSRSRIAAG